MAAIVTTDFSSLTDLVDALVTPPADYRNLDLDNWRDAYDELFDDVKGDLFVPTGSNINSVNGHTPNGTLFISGTDLSFTVDNSITVTGFGYTQTGGNLLQVSAGNNPTPIKINDVTDAVTGQITQISYSTLASSIILSGLWPASGTGSIVLDHLTVSTGGGAFLLQLVGTGVTLGNNPTMPATFLKPVGGTINEIHLTLDGHHLDATGLSISAKTFYDADTYDELAAVVNSIFGGNNTHTASGDGQTLIGGGGNDTYDFATFVPGVASELINGGADTVKTQFSYLLDDNIENAQLMGPGDGRTLTGNGIGNKLIGSGGSDTLIGGGGADTMTGGGGDDFYNADATGDKAIEVAGGGTDTLFATATQTAGAEIEVLILGGAENINGTGNASNNIIQGNSGDNVLLGMAGADSIVGGGGNDKLDGGDGSDTLEGGAGTANTLLGGGGNDVLVSDNKLDSIDGGAGIDTVVMSQGEGPSFTLGAATENLTFTSATGGSNGIGNALANVFVSGASLDNFNGLGGNDTYYLQGTDTVTEDVGGGTDLVFSTTSFSLASFANVENLTVFGGGASTGTGNASGNVLTSDSGAHTLDGGAGNDTYNVQSGDFVIENTDSSVGGIDLVNAFLSDGELFDLTTAGTGIENLTLFDLGEGTVGGIGNALNNRITGAITAGAKNILSGGGGADTLIGGTGIDVLQGDTGIDVLQGGAGDDMYVYDFSGTGNTVTALEDTIVDSGGSDTIVDLGIGSNTHVILTLAASIENFDGSGATGIDYKITGNAGNNKLQGTDGADTLIGGAGNDYYVKGAGDLITELTGGGTMDVIEVLGGAGGANSITGFQANIEGLVLNDNIAGSVTGTAGADFLGSKGGLHTLQGGLGNDTYSVHVTGIDTTDAIVGEDTAQGGVGGTDLVIANMAETQEYHLLAGLENLTLVNVTGPGAGMIAQGNALANKITGAIDASQTIDGLGGNDTIIGGAYGDNLIGGAGADSLVGGLGNDTYVTLLKAVAVGALEDSFSDTGGIDTLLVDDQGVATSFNYTLAAAIENISISDMDSAISAAITGNAAANILTGSDGANKLDGAAGNDTLDGEDGADTLLGGLGNDSLDGCDGNDSIDGGMGDDTMAEFFGDDTFLISQAGDVIDVIEDSGTDTVIVGATGNAAYLNISGGNSFLDNVTFTGTVGVVITGNDVDNLLKGGTGADTIDGGLGADTLAGGNGNDYYIMAANDIITEAAAGGTADTVESRKAGYDQLDANVERLVLGTGAIYGAGNTLNNLITGNSAGNMLKGGGGADTMTGGGGADIFVLDGISTGRVATITDFVHGVDHIGLNMDVPEFAALFTGPTLTLGSFSAGVLAGSNPQLFYNGTTGQLYYDGNGGQAGQSTLIAVFAAGHRPDPVDLSNDFVQFNGFT